MKINFLNHFIKIVIVFITVATSNPVKAQEFDYALLLGEWSLPGKCNTRRYIYADNGNYSFIEKKQEEQKWQTIFQGQYVVKEGFVVISEYDEPGGFSFVTVKLSKHDYVFKEAIPGGGYEESIVLKRCPYR